MTARGWDVVVVGGGPAGAAAALLAARAGWQTALFDGATFPRQKVCGEYLGPAGWRLLANLGLGPLRSRAVTLPHLELTADAYVGVSLNYDDPQAAPAALSRYVLDEAIVESARAAGVELFVGRRVRHVLVDDGRAVGIECAGNHDHETGEQFFAKLVIAADGRRSVVVRDTGRIVVQDTGVLGFKRHVTLRNRERPSGITMHALAGGYLGVCPTDAEDVNLCGCIPRHLVRDVHGDIDAALRCWIGPRPELQTLLECNGEETWHTMPDVSVQAARPHVAGVLYVGDAQGTIEPLAGQGMTMALASAEMAVEHVRRTGVENVDASVQCTYDEKWHRSFDRAIRASTWFGRLLRRPALLKAAIRGGRTIPGLADYLFGAAYRRTVTAN